MTSYRYSRHILAGVAAVMLAFMLSAFPVHADDTAVPEGAVTQVEEVTEPERPAVQAEPETQPEAVPEQPAAQEAVTPAEDGAQEAAPAEPENSDPEPEETPSEAPETPSETGAEGALPAPEGENSSNSEFTDNIIQTTEEIAPDAVSDPEIPASVTDEGTETEAEEGPLAEASTIPTVDPEDPAEPENTYPIGWNTVDGAVRYYYSPTEYHQNAFRNIDGKVYYFDGNGNRVIGVNFCSSNGRFYYFNPTTGVIQKKQGWINWNSKRYYSAANGVLYNTRFISVSGKKYYAGTDAAMKNGVFKVGTSYYYAVPSTYIVQTTEGFISWNGHRYYAKKGGELFKSITLSVRGVKYHLQSDGAFMTGMHKWGDALYYANSKGELRTVKGFFTVNGNSYFSQLGGKLLAAMTFTVNGQPYHALSNGAIVKGVHKWGSYYYYSDPATGKIRTTAGFVKWNNKLYYVLSGGKLITGRVYTVKGVYYEADATGASVKLDAINKLLSIMRAQVGTATGKKYWTWYYVEHRGNNWPFKNTDATPWCGAFVAWCFNEAGLFSKISAVENYGNCGYVPSYTAYANKNDKWVSTSTAKAGDIIIFGSGSGRHVGIVESNDGKTITTIEGNAGPTAVSAPGLGAVVRNTYSVTASKIRGIIRVL